MNEVDAEARHMLTGGVRHSVAKLIFFLIAEYRECGYRRDELVVSKRFESGYRLRSGAERKSKSKAECRVSLGGQMQQAYVKRERSDPCRTKEVLLTKHDVPVAGMRRRTGGRERTLLNKRVIGRVVIHGRTEIPLRTRRLRPIEPQCTHVVSERDRYILGHRNGADTGNQSLLGKGAQRIELSETFGTIRNARVLMN